jgi:hypothetical protein
MSAFKRRNRISGRWSPRLIEMLESPAYRALSLSGHRVISRIEIELGSHGGNDNGRLPVTFDDFVEYGIDRDCIAPAIREAEALGFIRVTERGRGGNAEHRQPNKFFLTFSHGRDSRANPPTHDWRKIKTLEEAMQIAKAARKNKDERAVRFGQSRAKKTKSQSGNPRPKPVGNSPIETANSPTGKTPTTGSVGKTRLLSISRVGEHSDLRGRYKDWDVRRRVLTLLEGGQSKTVKELWEGASIRSRSAADGLLNKLVNDGLVERAGRGLYRRPRAAC